MLFTMQHCNARSQYKASHPPPLSLLPSLPPPCLYICIDREREIETEDKYELSKLLK